jgi:hypothetical protein
MGAEVDTLELEGTLTERELRQRFKEHQDNCAEEDGNSYSGRLNMCPDLTVEGKVFESHDQAYNYMSDKAQKWENALAVRFKVSNKVQETAKTVKLRAKSKELDAELIRLTEELHNKTLQKIKAKPFHSCTRCKSRINTEHIHGKHRDLCCPVCGIKMMSLTDMKKIERMNLKISQNYSLIQADRKSLQDKANSQGTREMRWLILGVCSS